MDELEISERDRRELVDNVMTALEVVPDDALLAVRDALEKKEPLDSVKIRSLTGLTGQSLEGVLMLFQNADVDSRLILLALETALAVSKNARKNAEKIDLSWTGPVQFSVDGRTTPSVIEEMIECSRNRIIITGYSITKNADRLIRLLEDAIRRGVEVILVIHSDEENSNLAVLSELWTGPNKPKIYSRRPDSSDVYFKIHAKMIVVDRTDLLVTSANLTWHGMTNNFEIGVRIRGNTARKADTLIRDLIHRSYLKEERV